MKKVIAFYDKNGEFIKVIDFDETRSTSIPDDAKYLFILEINSPTYNASS